MDEGASSSIPILTADAASPQEYRILEVPPEVEALIERKDVPLQFNGRLADEAALVTHDATYAVRQVAQSNSLLLCSVDVRDNGSHALVLRQNVQDTLELVRTCANLERIMSLLDEDMYTGGEEHVHDRTKRHYTRNELMSVVQASEAEFTQGLRAYHVIELDGYLRRVAPDLVVDLLHSLLAHVDIFACAPDRVPFVRMCEALAPRACRAVAEAMVGDWFCATPQRASAPTVPLHIPLARESVAQFLGLHLLRTQKRMPLIAFMDAWHHELGIMSQDAHLALLQVREKWSSVSIASALTLATHLLYRDIIYYTQHRPRLLRRMPTQQRRQVHCHVRWPN